VLVQSKRNKHAALKLIRKLLKAQRESEIKPDRLIDDLVASVAKEMRKISYSGKSMVEWSIFPLATEPPEGPQAQRAVMVWTAPAPASGSIESRAKMVVVWATV
jgi:hypothetical protein